nr:MAG TPA: hypothetical protein [Caudoviricetes sp.]
MQGILPCKEYLWIIPQEVQIYNVLQEPKDNGSVSS